MSNDVVTMHDMFQLINDAAGLSGRSYVLSKELARVGVELLAFVSRFTGKEPLLSAFNIYMLNRNNDFDCSKSKRELGFHCRPFSESIRDTVAWLRQEGYAAMPARAKVVDVRLPALAPSVSRQA